MMKRLLKIGLALVALLVLAGISGLVLLRTEWFRERLRRRVIAEMEKATGGKVELVSVRFDARRWHARLEGLRIAPVLQAEAIEIDLRVQSYLRRDVDVAALRVIRPEIRIVVAPDGSTNLPTPPGVARGGSFTEPLLNLAIGHFEVREGTAWWNDQRYSLQASIADLRADLRFHRQGFYEGQVLASRTVLAGAPRLPAIEQLQARLRLRRDQIEIADLTARTAHSELKANGTISQLQKPRFQFQYDAIADARDLRLQRLRSGRVHVQGSFEWAGAPWSTRGKVSAQQMAGAISEARFSGVSANGDYTASPDQVRVENLTVQLLGGRWTGKLAATRNNVQATGRVNGVRLERAIEAVTTASRPLHQLGWTGVIAGPVQFSTPVRWASTPVAVQADLTVRQGNVEGAARLSYDGRSGEIDLADLRLVTPDTTLSASGRLSEKQDASIRFQLTTANLEELTRIALAATNQRVEAPLRLEGRATVQGQFTGTVAQPRLAATLDVGAFVHQGRGWDSFSGRLEASREQVRLAAGRLSKGNASISLQGSARLTDGAFTDTSPFEAEAGIRDTSVEDLLALAGAQAPATGSVTGQVKLKGTQKDPRGAGAVEVRHGVAWGEPFDSLRSALLFEDGEIRATGLRLTKGKGSVSGNTAYHHDRRAFRFDLKGEKMWSAQTPWSGSAGFTLAGAGQLAADSSVEKLTGEGTVEVEGLVIEGRRLGNLSATARATGTDVAIALRSNVLGSGVTGQGDVSVRRPYRVLGRVEFQGLDLAAIPELRVQGSADGFLTVAGRADSPDALTAQGSVTRLELKFPSETPPPRTLRNAAPLTWRVANRKLALELVHLTGEGSDLKASGSVDLRPAGAVQVAVNGTVNLAVLGTFDPKLQATGFSTVNVNVGGTWRDPNLSGRVELRDGALGSEDLPLSLTGVSGAVTFARRRATIQKITAEAGGGELTLTGDAELGSGLAGYRLRLEARRVRLRYPRGLSSLLDGSFTLTGANRRSRLDGQVQITRAGTRSSVDIATLIAAFKEPARTPSANEWLQNTQLNVTIASAPDIRFETAIARNLQADVSMRLRGTALNPSLLGRINITQGEVEFQGTRYTLNRGDISFLNPFRIEPILNLDLETRVSGYDILLTLIGPAQKLNVTYRSDPPLTFNELVNLLAVGRAPTIDPTLAAQQTSQARAMTQIGADSIIGEAIAKPVTGRLQRFFGVSRLKLDPELIGPENTTTARITIEQQVGRDVTFTYTYNLASAQEQIIRVRWSINRQWSLEAIRDQNGLVAIDFLYKKRVR